MIGGLKQFFLDLHFTIPMPVLEAAFEPWNHPGMDLDEIIRQKVILARVRDAVSIRGGKIFRILLQSSWAEYTRSPSPYALGASGSWSTYLIPPEYRNHKDIVAALQVRFPYTIGSGSQSSFISDCNVKGTTLSAIAGSALHAQTGSNEISYPTPVLYEGNVIGLDPPQFNFVPWQVMVRLAYDDNFSDMDSSLIRPFSQVCMAATKAYIYAQLYMKVESNMVLRGAELGSFKELINSYADANDKYEEALLSMGGAEMFDPVRQRNMLIQIMSYI